MINGIISGPWPYVSANGNRKLKFLYVKNYGNFELIINIICAVNLIRNF